MTTKLDAVNIMLSCIGQSPLNTLQGTKSYYTVTALQILEQECTRVLLDGWDFNTDERYKLIPDENQIISIASDMLLVLFPQYYRNRYVIRKGKLYDKLEKTFKIKESLEVRIIWDIPFEDLPENFKRYVAISGAYKFCKRALGSEAVCAYTKEDVAEAYSNLLNYELESGNYTLIPEMRNRTIRGDI